jgi:hypothetical protein
VRSWAETEFCVAARCMLSMQGCARARGTFLPMGQSSDGKNSILCSAAIVLLSVTVSHGSRSVPATVRASVLLTRVDAVPSHPLHVYDQSCSREARVRNALAAAALYRVVSARTPRDDLRCTCVAYL